MFEAIIQIFVCVVALVLTLVIGFFAVLVGIILIYNLIALIISEIKGE